MKRIALVVLVLLAATVVCVAEGAQEGGGGASGAPKVTPPGTFPVVEEKVSVDVMLSRTANVEDLENNDFTEWYEEKTNVHFNMEQVPSSQMEEKVNITLASGDYPDVIISQVIDKTEVLLYGQQGVFQPLNDVIDTHSVHLKKLMNDITYIKDGITAPDGNIYALPRTEECYHCTASQKMFVYQPWLDKLGLDMPTTTEEFKQMLIAFKEDDPNGNGKADEVPLAGAAQGWHTYLHGFLMQPFEYSDGSLYLKLEDGDISFAAWTDGWREGLKYITDLYNEGLIAPESFTQDNAQHKQLGENPDIPILGASPAGWYGVFTVNYSDSGRFANYQAVPPLEGPDGTRRAARYNYNLNQQLIVTEKYAYPEVMVRWADWFYTLDGSISGHRGREGVAWRRAEPGEKAYTGDQGYYQMIEATQYGQVQNVNWQHTGLGHNSVYVRESMVSAQEDPTIGQEYRLWKWTRERYEPYQIPKEDTMPDMFFTPDQAREIADLRTTIQDFVNASVARFVTGASDINSDGDWDAYKRELEQMGVPRFVEIYQEAYDANMGN